MSVRIPSAPDMASEQEHLDKLETLHRILESHARTPQRQSAPVVLPVVSLVLAFAGAAMLALAVCVAFAPDSFVAEGVLSILSQVAIGGAA